MPRMSLLLTWSFVAGIILGAAFVGILYLFNSRLAQQLFAAGLLGAALIYVGFAGLNHGMTHLDIELSGLVVFGLLSLIGARRWPLVLGLSWLAHGGWDFWHSVHPAVYVPYWWPAFCVGFDWVVGIYILGSYARKRSLVTTPAKFP